MRSSPADAQRLQRLALAGGGVADEEHGGPAAVVQHQPRVGAVERHDAAVHGGDVVQRQDHLLEVAEVAEAVLERDRRHQQAAAAVVVEHGGQVAEAGERRRWDAVEVHGVGAGGDLLVRGDLEQVGEARPETHEAAVEVHEDGGPPDDGRVAEPLLALQLEPVERVLLDLRELARARVHRRVQQQRRIEQQVADEGDAGEQLAVASRHRPLVVHGVHADLGAGRDLAQHARPPAGDVLGDVAVRGADQPRERLDRLGEPAQRALVARRRSHLGAHHEEPVPAPPEVVEALDELVQLLAPRQQVARRAGGDGDALERVVGEQAEEVEQPLAPAQPELAQRLRVVRLEVVDVEVEHPRERGALDELLRARAHGALRVHDGLAVVEVESLQGHARSPGVVRARPECARASPQTTTGRRGCRLRRRPARSRDRCSRAVRPPPAAPTCRTRTCARRAGSR